MKMDLCILSSRIDKTLNTLVYLQEQFNFYKILEICKPTTMNTYLPYKEITIKVIFFYS